MERCDDLASCTLYTFTRGVKRMSGINNLGFKSQYVLMKIGQDLAESLEDTIEATIPESLEAAAAEIQNKNYEEYVIPLKNVRYVPHNDEPLY